MNKRKNSSLNPCYLVGPEKVPSAKKWPFYRKPIRLLVQPILGLNASATLFSVSKMPIFLFEGTATLLSKNARKSTFICKTLQILSQLILS